MIAKPIIAHTALLVEPHLPRKGLSLERGFGLGVLLSQHSKIADPGAGLIARQALQL
jgi:hypothetical protein